MNPVNSKILFIDHDPFITGSTISLFYLIEAFKTAGYEIHVLSPKREKEAELLKAKGSVVHSYSGKRLSTMALDVHFISEFSLQKTPIVYFKNFIKIMWGLYVTMRTVKYVKPVLIYNNEYVTIQTALIGCLYKIPVVTHIRSQFVKGILGIRRNFLKYCIIHLSSLIFAITTQEKLQLDKLKDSGKIIVVREFLDEYNFKVFDKNEIKKKYNILSEDKIVLSLSGIAQIKGTKEFLLAADDLFPRISNLMFVLAGSITGEKDPLCNQYIKDCISIIARHPGKILFVGIVENSPELISLCDILVAPFTKSHFSRPVIEAMAQKKLIITTKLPHSEEFIEDGKNGILVEPGDYKSLSEKIQEVFNDPSFYVSVSENGYKTASENFNVKKNANEIVQRCKALIKTFN